MKSQRVWVTVLVAFVAFLSGGWLLQRGSQRGGTVYQQARLLDDILAYVAEYYVDSVGTDQLYDFAIDGFLRELNDPYTSFLREEDYRDLELNTTGNYAGVGMQIDVRDSWITVIAPIIGTPAESLGIASGDRIVQIDAQSTRGWGSDRAVRALRGRPGTLVKLTIVRPGVPDSLQFDVTRARIHVRSVQYSTMLDGDVGYVSLVNSSISEQSAKEISDEITRLRSQGAKALLLDLRGNPGGVLDQGVAVADLFLDRGAVVVETRGRAPGASQTYRARTGEQWPDMPIVTLVDGGTASAAEIIAGALQDHDRALVLGTTSFGKGLVQTVYPLNGREFLKLTTGRWYTPSGRTIQKAHSTVAVQQADENTPVDTTRDTTQMFRTDGGRVVYGGGGIRPDIMASPDTLTDPEKAFVRALGSGIPAYRDVMTSYALELKGSNAVTDRGFQVTPAMRAEILRRLRARGVEMPAATFEPAVSLVSQQFAYEVTRYVFGRTAEFARRTADDAQVQQAIQLVKRARTPQDLLALAREGGN
ncbi:MAG TPA: S41 family peptidase [Gemmatimonadales bacterium]|nr:S41 family peptidase [Gemmatimonadales bacterium]